MKQNIYEYAYDLKRQKQHRNSVIIIAILSIFLFLFLFTNFILLPVRIGSNSMETDISLGGAIFVTPIDKVPNRGDIVLISRADEKNRRGLLRFTNALIRLFTAQQVGLVNNRKITGNACLRRVLALPGDTVYMRDYVLYVKTKESNEFLTEFEVCKKPYSVKIYSVPSEWDGLCSIGDMKEIKLKQNEYFVLADNRIEGSDSRVWGTIINTRISGRAILQYFPLNKIRFF